MEQTVRTRQETILKGNNRLISLLACFYCQFWGNVTGSKITFNTKGLCGRKGFPKNFHRLKPSTTSSIPVFQSHLNWSISTTGERNLSTFLPYTNHDKSHQPYQVIYVLSEAWYFKQLVWLVVSIWNTLYSQIDQIGSFHFPVGVAIKNLWAHQLGMLVCWKLHPLMSRHITSWYLHFKIHSEYQSCTS